MKRAIVCLAALLLVLGAGTARADIVVNGGFETGDFTGWTQFGNTGFTFVDGGANTGAFAANFGPVGSTGGITQTLPTVPGGLYLFQFFEQSDGGVVSSFEARWDGIPVHSELNTGGHGYIGFSFLVVATGANTPIDFEFRNDPAFERLDDVTVNLVVPEPASLALFGIGALGLIGGGAWRRRKRAS